MKKVRDILLAADNAGQSFTDQEAEEAIKLLGKWLKGLRGKRAKSKGNKVQSSKNKEKR